MKCRSGTPSAALLVDLVLTPTDFFFFGGIVQYPIYLKCYFIHKYLMRDESSVKLALIAGGRATLDLLDLTSPDLTWYIIGHLKDEGNVLKKKLFDHMVNGHAVCLAFVVSVCSLDLLMVGARIVPRHCFCSSRLRSLSRLLTSSTGRS